MTIKISEPFETAQDFGDSIINGLSRSSKTIECKWLYDKAGSGLFDAITEVDEYYPTRVEIKILRKYASELGLLIDQGATLLELGSGSCRKTRILLDELPEIERYVPVDISEEYIEVSVRQLRSLYPGLGIHPVRADFMEEIVFPENIRRDSKLLFFPGSTIGNLDFGQAKKFLSNLRTIDNVSAFVIGIHLVKDRETLIRAYDDNAGVTAAFNLNLLHRINRDLDTSIDTHSFRHEARWNEKLSRIEMHLVSEKAQRISILGETFEFAKEESIHTESSHKFSIEGFRGLARQAGWATHDIWTDEDNLFAVAVLR